MTWASGGEFGMYGLKFQVSGKSFRFRVFRFKVMVLVWVLRLTERLGGMTRGRNALKSRV